MRDKSIRFRQLILLLFAAALFGCSGDRSGVELQQNQPPPQPTAAEVEVLTARQDLEAGTTVTDLAELFRIIPISTSEFDPREHIIPAKAATLLNKQLVRDIEEGQPIRESDFGP